METVDRKQSALATLLTMFDGVPEKRQNVTLAATLWWLRWALDPVGAKKLGVTEAPPAIEHPLAEMALDLVKWLLLQHTVSQGTLVGAIARAEAMTARHPHWAMIVRWEIETGPTAIRVSRDDAPDGTVRVESFNAL